MKVINLFGGPGAGKSTIAAGVFYELKKRLVNAELVTEFAKDLTWEKRQATLGNQIYIFGKQQHRIWRLRDQVDFVVTDSPLLLSLIYSDNEALQQLAAQTFDEFENVNYFVTRSKPYNPAGRNQTEDEALELDWKIINTMEEWSYEMAYLYPEQHDPVDFILNDLGVLG